MNRSNITHAVASAVKALSILLGFSAYAHFIPGQYGLIAIAAFAIASTVKDFLSALEKRLESPEATADVAIDTAKDAISVVQSELPAPKAQPVTSSNHPK